MRAHRVAWLLRNGQHASPDRVLCHSCDRPECCNPTHLWLGTQADNLADMRNKGRGTDWSTVARGEACYNAALSNDNILNARHRHDRGETWRSIAADLGVDERTIAKAAQGKTWKHVA